MLAGLLGLICFEIRLANQCQLGAGKLGNIREFFQLQGGFVGQSQVQERTGIAGDHLGVFVIVFHEPFELLSGFFEVRFLQIDFGELLASPRFLRIEFDRFLK